MKFYINKYHFFKPQNDAEVPDISFVPPMQRRKMSQLIKMTVSVAHDLTSPLAGETTQLSEVVRGTTYQEESKNNDTQIATVYSSRYGEWEQTLKQLLKYFEEHEVSPTGFGLSVHNAAIGMVSLLNKNQKSYTSIAGSEHTFDSGFIESVATLSKEDKVLYISSNERTPDLYRGTFPENIMPLCIGMIMSRTQNTPEDIPLEITFDNKPSTYTSDYQHILDFISFLKNKSQTIKGNNFTLRRL